MTTQDTHGAPIPIVPTTTGKQIRKAWASALISVGMAITALQAALPYLHNAPWLPTWAAPAVAALGAGWAAWKQAADIGSIVPVNLSTPTRDMRDSIPEDASTQTVQPPVDVAPPIVPPLLATAVGTPVDEFQEADVQNRMQGE